MQKRRRKSGITLPGTAFPAQAQLRSKHDMETSIVLSLGFTLPRAQMVTNNGDTLRRGRSKVNKYESIHTLALRQGIVPGIRAYELESLVSADSLVMTVAESRHNTELASVTIQPLQVLICVTDYPIIIDTTGSFLHANLNSFHAVKRTQWTGLPRHVKSLCYQVLMLPNQIAAH